MIIGKEYKDKFLPHWEKWKRVTFRGYNYGGIIANQLGNLHHNDFKGSKKQIPLKKSLKLFLKGIVYRHEPLFLNVTINQSANNFKIGFLKEEDDRTDYDQQCNYVLNELSDYQIDIFKINKSQFTKKRINLKHVFKKMILVSKIVIKVSVLKGFKVSAFAKNIFLISKCLFYFDFLSSLTKNKYLKGLQLLIVFSDMKEYGNMFVQAANKYNIPTATLQHGIYIQQDDTNFSQSAINYLNSPSKYLLGWGDSVVKMFLNTGKNAILLSGTSVNDYQVKQFYSSLQKNKTELNNRFCLLFSRQTLSQSNLKMLAIAEDVSKATGMRYDVLMHPSNVSDDYSFENCKGLGKALKGSSNLIELIDTADFCICHSTTVYFTVLLKRKRCFRLNDDLFIDYGGLDDMVSNADDLLSYLKNDESISAEEKDKKVERLLINHFGQQEFSYKTNVKRILVGEI